MKTILTFLLLIFVATTVSAVAYIPNNQILPLDIIENLQLKDTNSTTNNNVVSPKFIQQYANGFEVLSIIFFVISACCLLLSILIGCKPNDGFFDSNLMAFGALLGALFYGGVGLLFNEIGKKKRNHKSKQIK